MLITVSPAETFAALPEQARRDHRKKIGIRVRAFLDNFYVESRDAAVMAVDVDLWANALQIFTHAEIMDAFGKYFDTGPRSRAGRLIKPDPGAIKALIYAARPKPEIVPEPEPEEKPRGELSAETQQVIDGYLSNRPRLRRPPIYKTGRV